MKPWTVFCIAFCPVAIVLNLWILAEFHSVASIWSITIFGYLFITFLRKGRAENRNRNE